VKTTINEIKNKIKFTVIEMNKKQKMGLGTWDLEPGTWDLVMHNRY